VLVAHEERRIGQRGAHHRHLQLDQQVRCRRLVAHLALDLAVEHVQQVEGVGVLLRQCRFRSVVGAHLRQHRAADVVDAAAVAAGACRSL
jgi:hypothetical protein